MTKAGGPGAGCRVVLLGATNPMGLAMTAAFLEAGAEVTVLARTPEQSELIRLRLGMPEGLRTQSVRYSGADDVEAAAREISAEAGPADHVIVCLRYGGSGDAGWGSLDEMGLAYDTMSAGWLPLLPDGGSFQFHVCSDRPSVGLQPAGPALVRRHETTAAAWAGRRRCFLTALGPDKDGAARLALELAFDGARASELIVEAGAFVGDPDMDALLAARAELDARLGRGRA